MRHWYSAYKHFLAKVYYTKLYSSHLKSLDLTLSKYINSICVLPNTKLRQKIVPFIYKFLIQTYDEMS